MRKIQKLLSEHYPPDEYTVFEEKGKKRTKDMLGSKSYPCWGQREIKGTDYYFLAQYSPSHKGDKIMVTVCKTVLTN